MSEPRYFCDVDVEGAYPPQVIRRDVETVRLGDLLGDPREELRAIARSWSDAERAAVHLLDTYGPDARIIVERQKGD